MLKNIGKTIIIRFFVTYYRLARKLGSVLLPNK